MSDGVAAPGPALAEAAGSGSEASALEREGAAGARGGELPPGVLVARVGAGANCSSAGSAIDILFYTSVVAGAIAVALSAAFPPRPVEAREGAGGGSADDAGSGDDPRDELR